MGDGPDHAGPDAEDEHAALPGPRDDGGRVGRVVGQAEDDDVRLDAGRGRARSAGSPRAARRSAARSRGPRRGARRCGRARRDRRRPRIPICRIAPPNIRRYRTARCTSSRGPARSEPPGAPSPFEKRDRHQVERPRRARPRAARSRRPRSRAGRRRGRSRRRAPAPRRRSARPRPGGRPPRPRGCACSRSRRASWAGTWGGRAAAARPGTRPRVKTPRRPDLGELDAGVRRRAAGLVPDRVALAADDDVVAGTRQDPERDLVRHRPARQPERRLLAEERGRALLEAVHRRILAVLVVADGRGGHRRPHRGRRQRDGVGAKIDGGKGLSHAWSLRKVGRRIDVAAAESIARPGSPPEGVEALILHRFAAGLSQCALLVTPPAVVPRARRRLDVVSRRSAAEPPSRQSGVLTTGCRHRFLVPCRTRSPRPRGRATVGRARARGTTASGARASIPGARAAPLPDFVAPQLATLVTAPPAGDEWLHEMKFDGYRILCRIADGRATLWSRNARDWTAQFPAIAAAAARLPVRRGAPRRRDRRAPAERHHELPGAAERALGRRARGARLLRLRSPPPRRAGPDGRGARGPQARAGGALFGGGETAPLRYSEPRRRARASEFFRQACRLSLEGIVSKRRDRPYEPGRGRELAQGQVHPASRSSWSAGSRSPRAARAGLGALLLGVHDGQAASSTPGKVGTGFTGRRRPRGSASGSTGSASRSRRSASARPARRTPAGSSPSWWPRSRSPSGPTTGGCAIRRSRGCARTSRPREVVRERPPGTPRPRRPAATGRGAEAGHEPGTGAHPVAATAGDAVVAGVRISHPDRVVYPDQGVTKGALARYYAAVADHILPHAAPSGRRSLVRCPEGLGRECFYQKHAGPWAPASLRRIRIREKTKSERVPRHRGRGGPRGPGPDGRAGDPHVERPGRAGSRRPTGWSSTSIPDQASPGRPSSSPPASCAPVSRPRGSTSFVKTTGGKGLHVVAPIRPEHGWDECVAFARRLAEALVAETPRAFTATMAKAARKDKIFLDYFRNQRGATSVAAYSTRARPGAPVSTPVAWDELDSVPAARPLHHRQRPAPPGTAARRSLGGVRGAHADPAHLAELRPPADRARPRSAGAHGRGRQNVRRGAG